MRSNKAKSQSPRKSTPTRSLRARRKRFTPVWKFRSLQLALHRAGDGSLMIEVGQFSAPFRKVSLVQSIEWFIDADEAEQDGLDYEDAWQKWFKDILTALAGGKEAV